MLLQGAIACPGAVVHHVCWQLSQPSETCTDLCGSEDAVDMRLTINGASTSEVVMALDQKYELAASYFDELDQPCHTSWYSADAPTVYSYLEQGSHDGHGV